MRMKLWHKLALTCAACATVAAGAGAYAAAPFATAWNIREAIKANDSEYLEDKIEWKSVRASLKESLKKMAFEPPVAEGAAPAKPSIWQRVKAYVGQSAVDRFVETTVTPTGMHGLLNMRKAYQAALASETGPNRPSLMVRARHLWSRVTRAEFKSLDRFEMDMIDKADPGRTIACVLERRGFEWKMTELRVHPTPPGKPAKMTAAKA